MIHLTIDGTPVEALESSTILQAARHAGIEIPTLCDHPALKPYGSCRLCVVEIEGWRTIQASCTMPASEGMVVRTNTPKLRAAREFILSLLFCERNHFCMFCQKTDGDCELQNAAYAEGMTHWPIQPNWNPYPVDTTHPYFALDNHRCILCRRCVRACGELVGNFTLGVENRGASTLLMADTNIPLGESTCIKCGTCVSVCPTGALIDKTSAYLGKDHLATRVKTVCPGCDLGCGVEALVLDNLVLRLNGDVDSPVNTGLLCEIGRHKNLGRDHARITRPMIRKDGKLVESTWEEALRAIAQAVKPLARQKDSLAALASNRLSAEALHGFKALFGTLGADVAIINKDAAAITGAAGKLNDIEEADCVVVVGTDLVKDHQVAGFFIKRNLPYGTKLIVIDIADNKLADVADYTLRIRLQDGATLFDGLAAAIQSLGLDKNEVADLSLPQTTVENAAKAIGISAESLVGTARLLGEAKKPVFVYGADCTETLKGVQALAQWTRATLVTLPGGANSAAAHYYGLDKPFHLNGYQAVYAALGDDEPTNMLMAALVNTPFKAIQASYVSAATECADVVLPVETWLEQEGHYVNAEGRLQKTARIVVSYEGVCSNEETLQRVATAVSAGINEPIDAWQIELAS